MLPTKVTACGAPAPPETGLAEYRPHSAEHPSVIRLDDLRPERLRAWAAACAHLRAHGLEPLPPAYVVRALKNRGWW